MTSDYDDVLRYIFSVKDRHDNEVYRYEPYLADYSPIVELLICVRELFHSEPDTFPIKVYRSDVTANDLQEDEFVVIVTSRRQVLDLIRQMRSPRIVHLRPFREIVTEKNNRIRKSLKAAQQAVTDLKREVDDLKKNIPSGNSYSNPKTLAERIADSRARFLPMPEGIATLTGTRLEFEGRLRHTTELWFGPIHHDGIIWWCQGFKPMGPWKWSTLVPGEIGLAVTHDGVAEQRLPEPVTQACFAFTGLRKRAILPEQVAAAAGMSKPFLAVPTLKDMNRQIQERSKLLEKLSAARDEVQKLEFQEDFWNEGLNTEPPFVEYLSGRKHKEIQSDVMEEEVADQTEEQAVVRVTYVNPALKRRKLSLPISVEWAECNEDDLFFHWKIAGELLLVSLIADRDQEIEELKVFTLHEVTISNGIRRGIQPLLRLIGPAEWTTPMGADFDHFCALVIAYIAQQSRGLIRSRYVRRIAKVKELHVDLWNRRKALGPGWEARKISARAAEDRPTPLELPNSLIFPPRAYIAFRLFTTRTESIICDPVFWNSAIWIIRATKPAGVPVKKTNLTVSPISIRVDADGAHQAEPPKKLVNYLIDSGLLSRRSLDPGQENAVVYWAIAEHSRIIERIRRMNIDTSEIDSKIAFTAKRISRLEAKMIQLDPALSLKEFFGIHLRSWRVFFPFDYYSLAV